MGQAADVEEARDWVEYVEMLSALDIYMPALDRSLSPPTSDCRYVNGDVSTTYGALRA